MSEPRAADRYEIAFERAQAPQRWFRSLGTLVANAAALFGGPSGPGATPSNPGGRRVKVVDRDSGEVVLEFVEQWGDDAQVSLSVVEADLESLSVSEFQSKWL